VNPVLILTLIPTFAYVVYPFLGWFFEVTPLRKIGIGLALTGASFALSARIEASIQDLSPGVAEKIWVALEQEPAGDLDAAIDAARDAGKDNNWLQEYLEPMPNIGWQFLAYVILTSAEILVSIVCLEFAYTQAPRKMKSFLMGIFFAGVFLGNFFTFLVNLYIQIPEELDEAGNVIQEAGTVLGPVEYYWFFVKLMAVATVAYIIFARFLYRGRTYVQGEQEALEAEADAEGVH